jgi:hypothetical protein
MPANAGAAAIIPIAALPWVTNCLREISRCKIFIC